MNVSTYQEFFRDFVLRKKQDLVNPRFHGVGEVILPKASLIHFLPRNETDIGPSTSEAFISNFPKEVFIDFPTKGFEALMGNGRLEKIEPLKLIQAYRGSHYVYNWTRDVNTVYGKENVLLVKSYGLMPRAFIYRPSVFMGYEKYFNNMSMVLNGVNEEALKRKRKQYLRIDLPLVMPSFVNLCMDYGHFLSAFNADGKLVINRQMLNQTKAEGAYWLLDLLAFLVGQYEYSLLGKLSSDAMDDLHLLFTFQSKTLVVKLGLLKGWFDEANAKVTVSESEPRKRFEALKTTSRFNAVKRFYLALMSLSRNHLSEKEIIQVGGANEEGKTSSGSRPAVAQGAQGAQTEVEPDRGEVGGSSSADAPGSADSYPGGLLDALRVDETDGGGPGEVEGATGTGSNHQDLEEWTSAVDDDLLEVEEVVSDVDVRRVAFESPVSGVEQAINDRAKDGAVTVAEKELFLRKGTRYQHIEMENGQTFEEFIQITPEELKDLGGEIEGEFITILDESMKRSRTMSLKLDYPKHFLHKDTCRMFLAMQNAGYAMNDFKHEVVTSVEGSYDVYSVQYHHPDGEQTTIHPRFPRVNVDDGSFVIDSVKSHMQQQRKEKVFRKISADTVALTTYYDRKLMIKRSEKMVDNLGSWMTRQIQLQAKVKGYTYTKGGGKNINGDYQMPRTYSMIGKQYKTITVGDVTLDFQIDALLEKYPGFKHLTKADRFLVGVQDGQPLTLDAYGNLFKGDVEFSSIEDLLGTSLSKAPLEHAVINISGYPFPLGVVLCFYFGIDALLKAIGATTRTVPIGTRPKLSDDEYAIKFNDEYLIFNRREKLTTMIFGGMPRLNNISNFSRSDLNNRNIWHSLMGDPKVRPSQFQEMDNLYRLFIDPISRDELKRMKLSESFHYLLIDAARALETDYARAAVEIEEQRIVGYERFAGHLYSELCRSHRQFRNKGRGRKHRFDFNPDSVLLNIATDTSANLVEEVGPIHQVKDQEEVTFGGTGGRSEITVRKAERMQLPTYQGIISEANKDSSKVGFVTYLSSDANIADFRGNIDLKTPRTATGDSSVTMNLFYGGAHDD